MKLLTLLAAPLLLAVTASGEEPTIDPSLAPPDKGLAIAVEAERRDAGFGDSVSELRMELTSADGRVRTRRLTWKTLEMTDPVEGDRSLTIFHEPRDIAGTGFLSWTHVQGEDDQWLYLPALKRVKRIASANKSSAFVGSEFAYEDLLSDEVEKFDYLWLRNEPCGALHCFVIQRVPRYEDSGYARQLVWIDRHEFRPVRIEYYNRKEELEKTLYLEQYKQYLDRYWRAQLLRMENHQKGKTTVLDFEPFVFRTGLTEQDFDPAALRRLR